MCHSDTVVQLGENLSAGDGNNLVKRRGSNGSQRPPQIMNNGRADTSSQHPDVLKLQQQLQVRQPLHNVTSPADREVCELSGKSEMFFKKYHGKFTYRTHYAQMSQATFFDKISRLQKPILCLSNFDFLCYLAHLTVLGAICNQRGTFFCNVSHAVAK